VERTILLERLQKLLWWDSEVQFAWLGVNISITDVSAALADPCIPEISEPFKDDYLCPIIPFVKSKEWHLGRIKFLYHRLDNLEPIEVQNRCEGSYQFPIPVITDGRHRLLASIAKGCRTIDISYFGMDSLLDYLTGACNEIPYEPIDFR
jgi:hypothetical protein